MRLNYLGEFSHESDVEVDGVQIMSQIWIQLKFVKFLISGKQSIRGNFVYKVVSDDKVAVFAAKPSQNDIFRIYTLRESDRQLVLKKHDKYQDWGWDLVGLFQEHFSFLLLNYGFKFVYKEFGNAVDANGKFYFYGPMNAYSFYNENGCFTFFNLVQRKEWDAYKVDKYVDDQSELKKGVNLLDGFYPLEQELHTGLVYAGDESYIKNISILIRKKIEVSHEIYGISVLKNSNDRNKALKTFIINFTFNPNINRTLSRNYMPHLLVDGSNQYLGIRFCELNVSETDQSITSTVERLYDEVDYSVLKVGTQFTIKEGLTTIGVGKVQRLN